MIRGSKDFVYKDIDALIDANKERDEYLDEVFGKLDLSNLKYKKFEDFDKLDLRNMSILDFTEEPKILERMIYLDILRKPSDWAELSSANKGIIFESYAITIKDFELYKLVDKEFKEEFDAFFNE